jgi:hypothetical protein
MFPTDRRDQLIDPDLVAVEQGYDELRESIVGVDPQHAGEEIPNIGRRTMSQQGYRRMMPQKRMSRIPVNRLPEHDKCVLIPICQIVHRGKLYGDLGIVGQCPRLFYFLDRPEDLVRIVRPNPVALLQETFCDEVPGAAPKPIVPAALMVLDDSPFQ